MSTLHYVASLESEHAQHNIILRKAEHNLVLFRTARELVSSIADAMQGYAQAFETCSVLHPDISVSNIAIAIDGSGNRRGLLIDWDHCIPGLSSNSSQPHTFLRRGTWKFLSLYLAQDPGEEHTAIDGRESALHVLMWCALRYLPHGLHAQYLVPEYLRTFDAYVQGGIRRVATPEKRYLMAAGGPQDVNLKHTAVTELIQRLCNAFWTRYAREYEIPTDVEDEDLQIQYYEVLVKQRKTRYSNIHSGDWLYATMRRCSERLPVFEEGGSMDWIDNSNI